MKMTTTHVKEVKNLWKIVNDENFWYILEIDGDGTPYIWRCESNDGGTDKMIIEMNDFSFKKSKDAEVLYEIGRIIMLHAIEINSKKISYE